MSCFREKIGKGYSVGIYTCWPAKLGWRFYNFPKLVVHATKRLIS